MAPRSALLFDHKRACLAGAPERAEVTRSAQGAEPLAELRALGNAEAEQVVGGEVGARSFPATELALELDLGRTAEPAGGCARLGGGAGEGFERVRIDGRACVRAGRDEDAGALGSFAGGGGGVETLEDGGGVARREWGEEGGGERRCREWAPTVAEGAVGFLGKREGGVSAAEDSPFVE